MKEPNRPMLRWHGGKWRLAPWIIAHFPDHRRYTEVYGGAASVLIRKPRVYAELWNDLDDAVFSLMTILQEGGADELITRLRLTPFSRREFELAYQPATDALESARRLIVRSFMGHGSDGHNAKVKTGFRGQSRHSNTTPARDWANYPEALELVRARIMGVNLEHRPALKVLADHDGPDCLHFLDPPYLPATRSDKSRKSGEKYHAYSHEMTVQDHEEMLHHILMLKGMVVLCGYPSGLYDDALKDWRRETRAALADGALARTEVIWMNPAARDAAPSPTLWCANGGEERAALVRQSGPERVAAEEAGGANAMVQIQERPAIAA